MHYSNPMSNKVVKAMNVVCIIIIITTIIINYYYYIIILLLIYHSYIHKINECNICFKQTYPNFLWMH